MFFLTKLLNFIMCFWQKMQLNQRKRYKISIIKLEKRYKMEATHYDICTNIKLQRKVSRGYGVVSKGIRWESHRSYDLRRGKWSFFYTYFLLTASESVGELWQKQQSGKRNSM